MALQAHKKHETNIGYSSSEYSESSSDEEAIETGLQTSTRTKLQTFAKSANGRQKTDQSSSHQKNLFNAHGTNDGNSHNSVKSQENRPMVIRDDHNDPYALDPERNVIDAQHPRYACEQDFDSMPCCCDCTGCFSTNAGSCLPKCENAASRIKSGCSKFVSNVAPVLPGVGDDEIAEENENALSKKKHLGREHSACFLFWNFMSCGAFLRNPNLVRNGARNCKILTLCGGLRLRVFPRRIYALLCTFMLAITIGFATAGCAGTWRAIFCCSCSSTGLRSADITQKYLYAPIYGFGCCGCSEPSYNYDDEERRYYFEERTDQYGMRRRAKVMVPEIGKNPDYIESVYYRRKYDQFVDYRKRMSTCCFPCCCFSSCGPDSDVSPQAFKQQRIRDPNDPLYVGPSAVLNTNENSYRKNQNNSTAANSTQYTADDDSDDIAYNRNRCCCSPRAGNRDNRSCCQVTRDVLFPCQRNQGDDSADMFDADTSEYYYGETTITHVTAKDYWLAAGVWGACAIFTIPFLCSCGGCCFDQQADYSEAFRRLPENGNWERVFFLVSKRSCCSKFFCPNVPHMFSCCCTDDDTCCFTSEEMVQPLPSSAVQQAGGHLQALDQIPFEKPQSVSDSTVDRFRRANKRTHTLGHLPIGASNQRINASHRLPTTAGIVQGAGLQHGGTPSHTPQSNLVSHNQAAGLQHGGTPSHTPQINLMSHNQPHSFNFLGRRCTVSATQEHQSIDVRLIDDLRRHFSAAVWEQDQARIQQAFQQSGYTIVC